MNREIEFRGKHIHTLGDNKKLDGIWVYGYLADESYIYSEELGGDMLVDVNTVGQYIGLKDKNGKKIFEGDKVKMHYFYETFHSETLGSMEAEDEVIGIIQYSHESGVTLETDNESYIVYLCVQEPSEELEIIGNIFEESANEK